MAAAASVSLVALVVALLALVDFSSLPGLDDDAGSEDAIVPSVSVGSLAGTPSATSELEVVIGSTPQPSSVAMSAASPQSSPAPTPLPTSTPTSTPTPTPRATAEPAPVAVTPTPVPTPEPTPTPEPAPEVALTAPATHAVVPGDTLANLAQRYGTSVALLQAANQLADPNNLPAGTQIFVPSADGLMPEGAPFRAVHIVQPGDTLANIGGRYGVSADAVAINNQISDVNLIREGMILYIPNGELSSPAPVPAVPVQPVAPVPSGVTHVVVDGETLFSISTQYGVTVAAIMEANGLTDPTYVVSGWVLTIPGF